MLRLIGLCLALMVLLPAGPPASAAEPARQADCEALRLAIRDLMATWPQYRARGEEFLRRLDGCEKRLPEIGREPARRDDAAGHVADEIRALRREALLANPLLDFDRILLVKRKPRGDARRPAGENYGLGEFLGLPRQSSWQQDTIPQRDGWENEIAVLSGLRSEGSLRTLYRPAAPRLVGDIDLHYDADRILFSMPDERLDWQVYEIGVHGRSPRQLTLGDQPGIHNFDSCYLPDGRIAFVSTAPLQGVPCNASVNVAMSYRMEADGSNIRQLCFDQDHNYSLTVANDGRILYLRWEYTDIPHVWGRYLFTMNPDGTCQREFYGSGSYWPNAIFYARAVPDHPSKVVGIVTGHHVGRVGELVIFDPARGRKGNEGVVQRIPGRAKPVEPVILDRLTEDSWPKFLHPFPLSEKYFLVAAKPTPADLWGIYLVDVFDNILLLKEVEGHALLEPIPLRPRKRPPVIADKVDLRRQDGLVYLEDVYRGPGLQGVPRGSVKKLRLVTYHFGYQGVAGIVHRVGADGPWEPKRVLGTVPVEEDGSAVFRVPAKTPISVQPLDAEGNALQLMRSWLTVMPGEVLSCVGCHEGQNSSPPNCSTIAATRQPSRIAPWRGPLRGFSFRREVQPVLDRYCVGCHDGSRPVDGPPIADLRAGRGEYVVLKNQDPQLRLVRADDTEALFKQYGGVFEPAYVALRRYVRVGGLESDIRLLAPGEFHAETTELVQMLRKGHHGVRLDEEAWDRLVTWIDLNAPAHGTWQETAGREIGLRYRDRRAELCRLYGGVDNGAEAVPELPAPPVRPVVPDPARKAKVEVHRVAGWPFDAAEARRRQASAGPASRSFELGDGIRLEMVLVPAGRFVMGDPEGHDDERPLAPVSIERPFWIGRFEVTNEQYRRFDPSHDSRYEHKGSWSFSEHHLGWPLNGPKQPVVRVSQEEARAFCRWLSARTGEEVSLPTEAEWEYACRAGTAGAMSFGGLDSDFSAFANMADARIKQLAYDTDGRYTADLVPRDAHFDDGSLVTAEVGRYRPNAWGIHDMHGNVWEWTRSAYRPYPYRAGEEGAGPDPPERVVVRGGSWYDRPKRCTSGFRLGYRPYLRVYNVGFRVTCRTVSDAAALGSSAAGLSAVCESRD